ncbi:MAG: DUF692 domain-containing protein [Planctomycetota bacterium]
MTFLAVEDAVTRRPAYGVGFSYRFNVHREVMESRQLIDFLEIPAEDYTVDRRRQTGDSDESLLQEAAREFPLIVHGTSASVGSGEPATEDWFQRNRALIDRTPTAAYSDHLAFTRSGTRSVRSFVSVPYTDLGVTVTAANIRKLKERLGVPVLVENVTYHFAVPGAQMTDGEFISRVAEEADCGILLDIANVHINATNHGYDPREFLDAIPGDRVVQAHFCGASNKNAYLLDTHFEPTQEEIWSLLEYALNRTSLEALILERDRGYHPFRTVLDELWRAKELFGRYRPADRPGAAAPTATAPDAAHEFRDCAQEDRRSLARFQGVLLRMLASPSFADRVFRGQETLADSGLDEPERKILASIPRSEWKWLAHEVILDNERKRVMTSRGQN